MSTNFWYIKVDLSKDLLNILMLYPERWDDISLGAFELMGDGD